MFLDRSGAGWFEDKSIHARQRLQNITTQQSKAEHEGAKMSAFPQAVLAKRAVQKERARFLYRRSLKTILSWAVHRDLFYIEANKTRAAFEANKDEADLARIDRLLTEGENKLAKLAHPDPYTVPWAPGGSKYARSPPVPPEDGIFHEDPCDDKKMIGLVYDFGRQEEW